MFWGKSALFHCGLQHGPHQSHPKRYPNRPQQCPHQCRRIILWCDLPVVRNMSCILKYWLINKYFLLCPAEENKLKILWEEKEDLITENKEYSKAIKYLCEENCNLKVQLDCFYDPKSLMQLKVKLINTIEKCGDLSIEKKTWKTSFWIKRTNIWIWKKPTCKKSIFGIKWN